MVSLFWKTKPKSDVPDPGRYESTISLKIWKATGQAVSSGGKNCWPVSSLCSPTCWSTDYQLVSFQATLNTFPSSFISALLPCWWCPGWKMIQRPAAAPQHCTTPTWTPTGYWAWTPPPATTTASQLWTPAAPMWSVWRSQALGPSPASQLLRVSW